MPDCKCCVCGFVVFQNSVSPLIFSHLLLGNLRDTIVNYIYIFWCLKDAIANFDIHSHIMREHLCISKLYILSRYTITYNEGTLPNGTLCPKQSDISSHIMREHTSISPKFVVVRYTLTYNEGTPVWTFFSECRAIYPHI